MNSYGRLEIQFRSIITPVLHGSELSVSHLGRLIQRKSQHYPFKWRLCGSQRRCGRFRRIEISFAAAGSRLHFLGRRARCLVTIPAELPSPRYWWCICAREVWLEFIVRHESVVLTDCPRSDRSSCTKWPQNKECRTFIIRRCSVFLRPSDTVTSSLFLFLKIAQVNVWWRGCACWQRKDTFMVVSKTVWFMVHLF